MTCARVTVRVYGRRERAGDGGREGVGEGGIRYFECKPTKPNEEGLQNKKVGGEDSQHQICVAVSGMPSKYVACTWMGSAP